MCVCVLVRECVLVCLCVCVCVLCITVKVRACVWMYLCVQLGERQVNDTRSNTLIKVGIRVPISLSRKRYMDVDTRK